MSEIEIVMFVALGFAAAALVALFIGRLVWSYAVKLGRRRIERSGPQALQELQADRDRLRAEYAMLSRRLEMRLDDLKTRLAEQTAEVSRHRNRIDQLAADLKTREEALAARVLEVQQLKDQIGPLENELAVRTQALQELKEQLRDREGVELELERELAAARAVARDRQTSFGTADRIAGLLEGPPDSPDQSGSQERARLRIEELSTLARQIETQRKDLLREHAELKALKVDIARSQRRKRKRTREETLGTAPATPVDAAAHVSSERMESLDTESKKLETTLAEAEREADRLQGELKDLDAIWTARLAELSLAPQPGGREELLAPAHGAPLAAPSPAEADLQSEAALNGGDADPSHDDGGVSSVITLANRIRALQRGVRG